MKYEFKKDIQIPDIVAELATDIKATDIVMEKSPDGKVVVDFKNRTLTSGEKTKLSELFEKRGYTVNKENP